MAQNSRDVSRRSAHSAHIQTQAPLGRPLDSPSAKTRPEKTPLRFIPFARAFLRAHGYSQNTADLLVKAWRANTVTNYSAFVPKWQNFCEKHSIDWMHPTKNQVIEFFHERLYVHGDTYYALTKLKSVLHFFCKILFPHSDFDAILHLLARALFAAKPPIPITNKPQKVWDVTKVLNYLEALPSLDQIPLPDLAKKTAMLLMLASCRRQHEIRNLDLNSVMCTSSYVKFTLMKPAKNYTLATHRANPNIQEICIPALPAQPKLCPVRCLTEYIKRTKDIRASSKLFITLTPPFKQLGRDTFSRWLKTVMVRSGIDLKVFQGHSVRKSASSHLFQCSQSFDLLLQHCGWANKHVFVKHYLRPIDSMKTEERPNGEKSASSGANTGKGLHWFGQISKGIQRKSGQVRPKSFRLKAVQKAIKVRTGTVQILDVLNTSADSIETAAYSQGQPELNSSFQSTVNKHLLNEFSDQIATSSLQRSVLTSTPKKQTQIRRVSKSSGTRPPRNKPIKATNYQDLDVKQACATVAMPPPEPVHPLAVTKKKVAKKLVVHPPKDPSDLTKGQDSLNFRDLHMKDLDREMYAELAVHRITPGKVAKNLLYSGLLGSGLNCSRVPRCSQTEFRCDLIQPEEFPFEIQILAWSYLARENMAFIRQADLNYPGLHSLLLREISKITQPDYDISKLPKCPNLSMWFNLRCNGVVQLIQGISMFHTESDPVLCNIPFSLNGFPVMLLHFLYDYHAKSQVHTADMTLPCDTINK